MDQIIQVVKSKFALLPRFTFANLIEVAIIAFLIYRLLILLKNSRAFTVLKGVFVVFIFTVLAALFHLDNILWILEKISATAVIALIVIFQPELRKALEELGKQKFVSKIVSLRSSSSENGEMTENTVDEISKGVFAMAKVKTGALIVIKQDEDLTEYINTGILVDGIVSSALLINTFEKNTPLHDGAAIIDANRMVSATCYLPLSENEEISKDLGTRHRAAIGMSETTDAYIIVVSEETGHVSVAHNGDLTRMISVDHLRSSLMTLVKNMPKEKKKGSKKIDRKAKEVSENE